MDATQRQYGRDDVTYATWYSAEAKRLALAFTADEIRAKLGLASMAVRAAAQQHLRAVAASTSMTSQSQRRAQARNLVAATGDERMSLSGALEIHELFPEHAKRGRA